MRQGGRGSVSLSEAEGVVQSRFLAYRGGVENSIFLSRHYSRERGGHRFARTLSVPAFGRKGSGRSSLSRYRPSSVLSGASKVGSHLSQACTTILLVDFFKLETRSTRLNGNPGGWVRQTTLIFFLWETLGKVKCERKLSERAGEEGEDESRGRVRRNTTAHRVPACTFGNRTRAVESLMRRFERGIGGAIEA